MRKFCRSAFLRQGSVVILAVMMSQISTTPARAFADVFAEHEHFMECLGMMLRGEHEKHERECGPNRAPEPFIEEDDGHPTPPVVETPPVVVTPPIILCDGEPCTSPP